MIARVHIKQKDMVRLGVKKALSEATDGLLNALKTDTVVFSVKKIVSKEHNVFKKEYTYTLDLSAALNEELFDEVEERLKTGL
ncbi:hypothetical protein LCGC14_0305720 [marine sediment metagenome]|uniref:Uncharacterized protein n=1 Tax=marine sediment metagenome TaxID=412755 RepID=A0A0F9WV28_9ZZZZ